MNRFRQKAALLLCLALFSLPACAAEEKASRPALKKDLVGTWELVSVRPVHDAQDPAFYPYQHFEFNSNSSMKFMTSEDPFTKGWLDKFRKQPAEIDYRLDEKGLLTLMWQKRPHEERAICAYVLRDVPSDVLAKLSQDRRKDLPKKGDLSLSFLNGKGGIAYQKVLKRVG